MESEDIELKVLAIRTLGRIQNLPREILDTLFTQLKDENLDIGIEAAHALRRHSPLPQDIMDKITELWNNKQDIWLQIGAALQKETNFAQRLIDNILTQLHNSDGPTRVSATNAVALMRNAPQELLNAFVRQSEEKEEEDVPTIVITDLIWRYTLPKKVLNYLLEHFLNPKRSSMHFRGFHNVLSQTFTNQLPLPQEILNKISSHLTDTDPHFQQLALVALKPMNSPHDASLTLPEDASQILIGLLKSTSDDLEDIRISAAEVLGSIVTLSPGVLDDITGILGQAELEAVEVSKSYQKSACIALRYNQYCMRITSKL
jgi:hypothetical protein